MNVFLEAYGLGRTRDSVSQLNLIGMQQINDVVYTTKGKNLRAWVVQCSMHSKLNAAELEELQLPNCMYLYSDIGIQPFLYNWLLANAPHLMLDMYFCSYRVCFVCRQLNHSAEVYALPKLAC